MKYDVYDESMGQGVYKPYRVKGEDLYLAFSLGYGYTLRPYGVQGFIYFFRERDFEIAIDRLSLNKKDFE